MFDHVRLEVKDLAASSSFYDSCLACLDLERKMESSEVVAFGKSGAAPEVYFLLSARGRPTATGVHIAFAASERAVVDAFHAAALAAGGRDNGAPGLRPAYHAHYYGAFVLDPDGNNIEAVNHG